MRLHVYKNVYIPSQQHVYELVIDVYINVNIMVEVYKMFTVLHFHIFSICLIEQSTNLL